jgi:hypothetical protein
MVVDDRSAARMIRALGDLARRGAEGSAKRLKMAAVMVCG